MAEELDYLKLRLGPSVWTAVQKQPWFAGAGTNEEYLRLLRAIAGSFNSDNAVGRLDVLAKYPLGVSAEQQAILDGAKSWAHTTLILQPWFVDGISHSEAALEQDAVDLKMTLAAFDQYIAYFESQPWFADDLSPDVQLVLAATFRARPDPTKGTEQFLPILDQPWFKDGLNEDEKALIDAGGQAAARGRTGDAQVFLDVAGNQRYGITRFGMAESGDKTILVAAKSAALAGRINEALGYVQTTAPKVEAYVGNYLPRYFIVELVDATGVSASVCGTGLPQGSNQTGAVAGIITLEARCLTAGSVAHELGHLFAGGGPPWVSEGIADLVELQATGAQGSYLGRPLSGSLTLESSTRLDSPAYLTEGVLGAHLLFDLQRIIGVPAMTKLLHQFALRQHPVSGATFIDLVLKNTPDEQRAQVIALLQSRISDLPDVH